MSELHEVVLYALLLFSLVGGAVRFGQLLERRKHSNE